MKKTQSILFLSITFVLLGAVLLWAVSPQQTGLDDHAGHDHSSHAEHEDDHEGHDHDAPDVHSILLHKQLPAALAAVDKATTAVKFGDKTTALAELARIKAMILKIQQDLERQHKPEFLNDRCPIMGNKIDPAKVTPALIRAYQGKKIAFCCASCVPQWDKMTELQKTAKLKALAPVETHHDPDDGGDHSGHVH